MDNYNSNIFVDNTKCGNIDTGYIGNQYRNYSNNQTLTVRSAEATSDGKANYIKINLSLYTHILFTYYKHRLIPGHLTFKHDSAKISENEPIQKFTFNELYGNETYCPSVNFQPSYTSGLHEFGYDSSRTYTYVNVNRGPYYHNNHYGYYAPFLTLFHNSFFDEQLIQSEDEEIPVIDTSISQIRTFSQNRNDVENKNNNSYQKNEIFLYTPQDLKDKHNYTNITRYPRKDILVNGTYKSFSFNLKKFTENTIWYDNNLFIENTKCDYNSERDILEYDVTDDISYLNLYSIYTPHQFMWTSNNAMLIESSQFLNFAFNDYGQIWLHDKGVNGHSKQFADNIYIKGYSKRDYLWRESRWSKSFYRTKIFDYSNGNIALKGTSDRDDKYNPLCVLGLNLSRKEYYNNSGDTEADRRNRFLELLKDAFSNSAIHAKYNYSDPYGCLNNYRFAKLFCNEQDDPRKDLDKITFSFTPHNTLYIDPFISKRYCESNFWTGRLSVLGKKGYNQYHKKTYQALNISSKIRDNEYQPNKLLYVVGQRSYVNNVIRGYYYNEKFWYDQEHTQEITGDRSNIYVDIASHLSYLYLGKFILDDGYFDNINVYTHQDNFVEGGYLNPVVAGEELLCINNYNIGYDQTGSKDHYKNLFENKIQIDSIMTEDEVTGIDDIHLSLIPSKELNNIDEFRPYYRILVNEYTNPDDHGLITQELYDLLYNSNIYDQKCYGTNTYKYRFTDFIPDDIKKDFDIKSNRDTWLRRILSQNNLYDKFNIAEDFIKRDIQALNIFYDRSFSLFSKFLKKDGTVDMNKVISDKAISTLISFDKDTNSIVFDKNLSVKGFNETTKKPETYLKTPDDFKTLDEWTNYHTKYFHLFFASNNHTTDSSIDTVSKTYTQTSVLDIQNVNANRDIKKYDGDTLLVTTNLWQEEPHSFQSMYFFPARLDFSLYIKTSKPVASLEDDTPKYPFYFTKLIYSDTSDNWKENGYGGFDIKKPASKCDYDVYDLRYKVQVKTDNGYETIAEYSISPYKEHTQLNGDQYMSIVEYDNKIKITPKPLFVSKYCKNVPIENKSEFIRILLVTGFIATSGCKTEISSKVVDNISSI